MIVNILFSSHFLHSSDKFQTLLLIGMLKTNMLNMFSLFWRSSHDTNVFRMSSTRQAFGPSQADRDMSATIWQPQLQREN